MLVILHVQLWKISPTYSNGIMDNGDIGKIYGVMGITIFTNGRGSKFLHYIGRQMAFPGEDNGTEIFHF